MLDCCSRLFIYYGNDDDETEIETRDKKQFIHLALNLAVSGCVFRIMVNVGSPLDGTIYT